jgi:hypothetical protein
MSYSKVGTTYELFNVYNLGRPTSELFHMHIYPLGNRIYKVAPNNSQVVDRMEMGDATMD